MIGTANQFFRVNGSATGYAWDTLDDTDMDFTGWTCVDSITTLGTIVTGTWNATVIDISAYTNLAVNTDHLKLTDDTLDFSDNKDTNLHYWQGSFLEQFVFTISESS